MNLTQQLIKKDSKKIKEFISPNTTVIMVMTYLHWIEALTFPSTNTSLNSLIQVDKYLFTLSRSTNFDPTLFSSLQKNDLNYLNDTMKIHAENLFSLYQIKNINRIFNDFDKIKQSYKKQKKVQLAAEQKNKNSAASSEISKKQKTSVLDKQKPIYLQEYRPFPRQERCSVFTLVNLKDHNQRNKIYKFWGTHIVQMGQKPCGTLQKVSFYKKLDAQPSTFSCFYNKLMTSQRQQKNKIITQKQLITSE
ncbi:hypothetical protein ABPG74_009214 [Tetrahymena malaccensis]